MRMTKARREAETAAASAQLAPRGEATVQQLQATINTALRNEARFRVWGKDNMAENCRRLREDAAAQLAERRQRKAAEREDAA